MKVYAILISAALLLFVYFIKNKAFVGKNQSHLAVVNAQIDAASRPSGETGAPAVTAEAIEALPVAAPSPAATPIAEGIAAPDKGGMGERMKKINDARLNQQHQLQDSLDTPTN